MIWPQIIISYQISSFKGNVQRLKNLVLDQPIGDSVERATWWINHLIRNGGTVSLRFFKLINL